jgi:hypothetical protein
VFFLTNFAVAFEIPPRHKFQKNSQNRTISFFPNAKAEKAQFDPGSRFDEFRRSGGRFCPWWLFHLCGREDVQDCPSPSSTSTANPKTVSHSNSIPDNHFLSFDFVRET